MGKSSAYSIKNAVVTINGQAVNGLWDGDDPVSIAPLADNGVMMVGADGSSIFSQSANEAATITLKLQHTSPTHRLLHQILARQRAKGIRLSGFPITVVDIDSNEGGSTDQAFIQQMPTDQKGNAATEREWILVTGEWKPEIPTL